MIHSFLIGKAILDMLSALGPGIVQIFRGGTEEQYGVILAPHNSKSTKLSWGRVPTPGLRPRPGRLAA